VVGAQVNFVGVKNTAEKGSQMAISSDGQVLYHPNGSDILPLEAHTGRKLNLLRGHFDKVNCCVFHPFHQVGLRPPLAKLVGKLISYAL
jgi:hypothetical protein